VRAVRFREVVVAAFVLALRLSAGDENHVPKPGQFPPAGAGLRLAGELVAVDHVNRRGALRLDGDGSEDTYHSAPSHPFAMLPYGSIWFHGAPAELRDIPIGTRLHGQFLLPPEGDTSVAKPARIRAPQTHALVLEDDFSFYQRQKLAWKVKSVDIAKGFLTAKDPVSGKETVFTVDRSTRVWKGRAAGELEDLATDQIVQCNFTWAPEWQNGQMHIADVWVDDEARALATERQRRIHVRHQQHRWLAGWVDHVEHEAGGGGTVTLTLFGSMDSTLYQDVRKAKNFAVAAAEPTLRTWWQNHDKKDGDLVEMKDFPAPPTGSSGLQLRLKFRELLEGYRPGAIIRLRPPNWPNAKLPPEERMQDMSQR
jgi:hypothetical protein